MRIIPPRIPILLKKFPNFLPKYNPRNERMNVVIPITNAGVTIASSRKDKLRPTAKASMLVATDNITSTLKLEEVVILLDSEAIDSYIILIPMKVKSKKAIQWSNPEIKSIMLSPASHPIIGIIA